MPEKPTLERVRADQRAGKVPSTQAGEFVREETHHVREGRHVARSPQQAIAIGLSKARRAGVPLKPKKDASDETRRRAARDLKGGGAAPASRPSAKRSRAVRGALQREGSGAASRGALAKQARGAAKTRSPEDRSAAAKKAARTKTPAARQAAARNAARTRAAGEEKAQ